MDTVIMNVLGYHIHTTNYITLHGARLHYPRPQCTKLHYVCLFYTMPDKPCYDST